MAFAVMLTTLLLQCSTKQTEESQAAQTQDSVVQESARPVHWSYSGENGPANWASLSPVYALCGNGQNQSPINIIKSDAKGGATWKLDYKTTSLRIAHTEHMDDIIDNGHTN